MTDHEAKITVGFWDRLGTDDGGMPVHLPMGVNASGQGPEDDSTAHHFVCWCGDSQCPLTRALALAALNSWTAEEYQ